MNEPSAIPWVLDDVVVDEETGAAVEVTRKDLPRPIFSLRAGVMVTRNGARQFAPHLRPGQGAAVAGLLSQVDADLLARVGRRPEPPRDANGNGNGGGPHRRERPSRGRRDDR